MKLVFATHNQNKMKEVATLVPSYIELLSLTDIGCFDEIPETSSTIEGNALLKANFVKEHYGFDCFADDTGLEVPELNNEPGVYSARYAGPANDAQANMDKLLANLNNKSNRNARFKTVIVFIQSEKQNFLPVFARELLPWIKKELQDLDMIQYFKQLALKKHLQK